MPTSCAHTSAIRDVKPRTPNACEECQKTGRRWVELRLCLSCGHVGCCDSSEGKHATAHFRETKHPVMRTAEKGQRWGWCYVDEIMLDL